MTAWNFATLWEIAADAVGDAPAVVQGDRTVTWREFDRRADGIAATLLDPRRRPPGQGRAVPLQRPRVPRVGVRRLQGRARAREHQLPLRRRRARLPVGQRRRGGRGVPRLVHRPRSSASAHRLPKVATWLWVDDGTGPCPDWALDYETAAATPTERVIGAVGTRRRRHPPHVHRRHHRHAEGRDVAAGLAGRAPSSRAPTPSGGARPTTTRVRALLDAQGPGGALLPAPPLMHGTGQFTTFITLSTGGQVVLLAQRNFDPSRCSTRSRPAGCSPSSSWATRSPSRWPTRSTPTRTAGTSRACSWSPPRG